MMAVAFISALSTTAFAASEEVGSAADSVKWQVTAMKDSKAGLVVSPIGSIDFKYSVKSEGFVTTQAQFMVTVLNNFQGHDELPLTPIGPSNPVTPKSAAQRAIVDAATDFKLEVIQGSGFANAVSDSSKGFDVELQKGGVALSVDSSKPTLLRDSNTLDSFLATLDGLAANGSEAKGSFTAVAKKTGTEFKALPEGAYIGEATAAFKATWSK